MSARHRIWCAAVAVLGPVALLAAAMLGPGDDATAAPGPSAFDRVERLTRSELEPVDAERVAFAAPQPQRGKLEPRYYIAVRFETVAAGDAQLFEVRCPENGQQPLTGGVFAPAPGLVISNSSRTSPVASFPTRSRAWYEAVFNRSGAELSWKPFVTCAGA